MCAKYYENPTMLSRVIAKNVGDVFLRHTVVVIINLSCVNYLPGSPGGAKIQCRLVLELSGMLYFVMRINE